MQENKATFPNYMQEGVTQVRSSCFCQLQDQALQGRSYARQKGR